MFEREEEFMNKVFICFLGCVPSLALGLEIHSSENFDSCCIKEASSSIQIFSEEDLKNKENFLKKVEIFLDEIQKDLVSLPIVLSWQKRLCLKNSDAICEALYTMQAINFRLLAKTLDMALDQNEVLSKKDLQDDLTSLLELTLNLKMALEAEERYQREDDPIPVLEKRAVLYQTVDGQTFTGSQEVPTKKSNSSQRVSFNGDITTLKKIYKLTRDLLCSIENATFAPQKKSNQISKSRRKTLCRK